MNGDRIAAALAGRSIEHLADATMPFEVKIGSDFYLVNVAVYYSNHCWTRSRKDDDPDESVLFREQKRDGSIDERVFCEHRWKFSQQLPKIIAAMNPALCLQGGSQELFYRVIDEKKKGGREGWYICARLDINNKRREITLSVRSVHYRTNRPEDVRGAPKRFYAIFGPFYLAQRAKHDWISQAETKKSPPGTPGGS